MSNVATFTREQTEARFARSHRPVNKRESSIETNGNILIDKAHAEGRHFASCFVASALLCRRRIKRSRHAALHDPAHLLDHHDGLLAGAAWRCRHIKAQAGLLRRVKTGVDIPVDEVVRGRWKAPEHNATPAKRKTGVGNNLAKARRRSPTMASARPSVVQFASGRRLEASGRSMRVLPVVAIMIARSSVLRHRSSLFHLADGPGRNAGLIWRVDAVYWYVPVVDVATERYRCRSQHGRNRFIIGLRSPVFLNCSPLKARPLTAHGLSSAGCINGVQEARRCLA